MEHNIKLFTDSAADLPRHIQEAYDVDIVPLSVIFGEQEYKDGVTISPEEFYRKLASDPELPSTNQVNPHEFVQLSAHIWTPERHLVYRPISPPERNISECRLLRRCSIQSEFTCLTACQLRWEKAVCLESHELAAAGLLSCRNRFRTEKHPP